MMHFDCIVYNDRISTCKINGNAKKEFKALLKFISTDSLHGTVKLVKTNDVSRRWKKEENTHTQRSEEKRKKEREQIGNKRTMLLKELQSLRLTLGLLSVRLCYQSIFQYQYQYWNFSGAFGARTEQGTEQYTWLLLKSAPF